MSANGNIALDTFAKLADSADMTPAEINAAIATWMGWTDLRAIQDHAVAPFMDGRDPSGVLHRLPNYHGDLNACREAWLHLDEQKQWEFADELGKVIAKAMPESDIYRCQAVEVNATAPQRAEALLRTLNLWKE